MLQRSAARERNAVVSRAELRREFGELVRAGRALESLRRTDDLERLRACGDRMRELLTRVHAAEARAEELADVRQFHTLLLRGAGGDVALCVTCAENVGACDRAAATLRDYDRASRVTR